MKSCPTCNKTFTDPNLSFCVDDGTPLIEVVAPTVETTVVSRSSAGIESLPPTEVYKPRDWQAPDYQPPGFQTSQAAPGRRNAWPWVVGVVTLMVVVVGLGIAGAIILPKMLRAASDKNSSPKVERNSNSNANLNSNASVSPAENERTPIDEGDATPPPTDKDVVLAALTELEHDWTVANINADKQKLNRILADDYVGMSNDDGKIQGKADYIRTIERDTVTQKWEFEDLKVTLIGDRATLEGVLRFQLPDQEAAYRFTDKFVWRDGRWQAVGSEVSRVK